MTAISLNEFNTYSKKYLDLAVSKDVCIENGKYRFHLICEPVTDEVIPEQIILKPDDDLKSAITMDVVKEQWKAHIRKLIAANQ